MAGRKAAERITEEELAELEEILALTALYVKKHDVNMLKELDHRFHDVIYKATKSKTLNHVLSDFHHYIQRARMASIATPGRAQKVFEEHQDIFCALKAGDGAAAERLVDAHIQQASQNLQID